MFKKYAAYLKDNPHKYWFRAKLYGWGWTPARWQGWVTLLVFVALVFADARRLNINSDSTGDNVRPFFIDMAILIGLLLLICWKTGEKPRWQWGVPKENKK